MSRVKRGTSHTKRRNRVLGAAKGYHSARSRLLKTARECGNPPIYITENGMGRHEELGGLARIDDGPRVDFLHESLGYLREAISGGADVRGYFVWSLLDNFEWDSGFDERFGLIYVDYATGTRTPKRSFDWYADVIARNGLPD